MKLRILSRLSAAVLALLFLLPLGASASETDVQGLYKEHCVECHGLDRLGGVGPALLPQNLKRLRKKRALGVIAKGRPQTQMPAFGETLSKEQIAALVEYVYTPLKKIPPGGPSKSTRAMSSTSLSWSKAMPSQPSLSMTRTR